MFQLPYERLLRECGSKHLALYRALRDGIAAGSLPAGERLPSTRQLAELYGLSRGSVSLAYDMLAAEGYVRAGVGRGTFVCGERAAEPEPPPAGAGGPGGEGAEAACGSPGAAAEPQLSAWGSRVMEAAAREARREAAGEGAACGASDGEEEPVSFKPRGMGERWFPWMEWRSTVSAQWKRLGEGADPESATEGSLELRRAIASRLRRERGIMCGPEDIAITGGSMQAIAILAQLLLERGRSAVVENPGYSGTRDAARAAGAALIAAPVDGEGIVPRDWAASVLFVTPARHFPTGAVLKLERRQELLAWASRRGAWIVEDDFDSDFRWGGRPIEPLKSLDREGRVVYVGSFSRTMRTEVRIGYAVLPPSLREPFIRAKRLYDPYPGAIAEQHALANWMADGGYDRHMRRMRRIFQKLHAKLREGLAEEELGELFEVVPSDAGLLLFAYWRQSPEAYERLRERCRERGVCWGDGSRYAAEPENGQEASPDSSPDARPPALFGFAHLDEAEVETGLRRIREAARSLGLIGTAAAKRRVSGAE